MNRKTMKMLLTGKKPRLPSMEGQPERDTRMPRPGGMEVEYTGRVFRASKVVVVERIKLDPTLSKYSDAYAELTEIIITGLAVPAELLR